MQKLTTAQAEKISQLVNSLTIWALAVERSDNNHDQTIQYMTWHDQYADALAEFGIDVARYNHDKARNADLDEYDEADLEPDHWAIDE